MKKTIRKFWASTAIFAGILGSPLHAQLIPTNGLVAYYPFNGNADDVIGKNNGVVHGAVLTTNRFGQPDSAYSFDGSSSYIDLGAPANLRFPHNFTLAVWCLFSGGSPQNPRIISYTWGDGYELLTEGMGANRRFEFDIGAQPFKTTSVYPENKWHYVVLVDFNRTAILYVDGAIAGSFTRVPSPIKFVNNLHVGNNSGTTQWDWWGGCVDDVRIYNRALPLAEVQQLYQYECRAENFVNTPRAAEVTENLDPKTLLPLASSE